MAYFRRLVNQHCSENESLVAQDTEFFEDSQEPDRFSTQPQSFIARSYKRTSNPFSYSHAPPRFRMHRFPTSYDQELDLKVLVHLHHPSLSNMDE